jgi:hypothetical protein
MLRWLLRRLATRHIVVEAERITGAEVPGPVLKWGDRWAKTNRGPW